MIQRYRQIGEYTKRLGTGRPRITNQREDHFLVLSTLRDRGLPSTILFRQVEDVQGPVISTRTVYRRLQEYRMMSRRPAACPLLFRVERLRFASLADHVVPFAPFVGENFTLMHDNSRPHIARVVMCYLDEVNIRRLQWPARSLDLNLIENLWNSLGNMFGTDSSHQKPFKISE
ncbi:hypothetical protein BDFB_008370 [Asbolus verrucosus]|uniref:DDE 3 domain containing protein n=1 Tax=Asbolus verrucosus TaxID=1661398 RepID=A0A482VF48_ASBVE|nr:hypothetical protein BDFB_008370 [Asbolus verrucosus]